MNKTLPALPGKASALPPGAFEIGYAAHDGAQHRVSGPPSQADLDRVFFLDADDLELVKRHRGKHTRESKPSRP